MEEEELIVSESYRVPQALHAFPVDAFPPPVTDADLLLDGDAVASSQRVQVLRTWCDALVELLGEVHRGSAADAPVEEVWHWMAASERLTRCVAFADHGSVAGLFKAAEESEDQEGTDIATKWGTAVRQLKRLQKESSWNASYLRVVEKPLVRLGTEEIMESESLQGVVGTLLRSLHRIYCTSSFFKEHRMALLLQKILKVLIIQAVNYLVSPYQVASPPGGFECARRRADQLACGFQAFLDHYFITDLPTNKDLKPDRRPATAPGTGSREWVTPSAGASKRKDCADLGWWKATVRCSLEQADSCRELCQRMSALMFGCACLIGSLPALRVVDPQMWHEANGFIKLHGGLKDGGDIAWLLDSKNHVAAQVKVREVEERLEDILDRVADAGVEVTEPTAYVGDTLTVQQSGGVSREVLTLAQGTATNQDTNADLQENINVFKEELQRIGSQLDNLSSVIKRSTPRRHQFEPRPRGMENGVDVSDAFDHAAALEVAKRSSWYREPPPLLAEGVEFREVSSKIVQTKIYRSHSRPRTSQPRLFVSTAPASLGRPSTAPATSSKNLLSPQQRRSSTPEEDDKAETLAENPSPDEEFISDSSETGIGPPAEASETEPEDSDKKEAVDVIEVTEPMGETFGADHLESDANTDPVDPHDCSTVSWTVA